MDKNNPKIPSAAELRQQIVEIGQRLYDRHLVVATEGNISVRTSAEKILITPSGLCKGRLSADDLVLVDLSGEPLETADKKPSSESGMHLCVYNQRPDVTACVHAHPYYATACSVAGVSLTEPVLPEIVATIGQLATTEYATPSTPEVAASISPLVDNHDAIILKNHGALTVGPDLETAFMRMEMVEHLAQVVFLAHQMGGIDRLTPAQIEALRRIFGSQNNSPGDGVS